ncbi:MAG TPA: TolC family protein [Candidatus Acidoferrales bacterium]|nr:TolC family protein [Candidatus Acidoferrales bacterium]
MKHLRRWIAVFALFTLGAIGAIAQASPGQAVSAPEQKTVKVRKNANPTSLPGPQGFQEHIVEGKLTLSLDDAIRLALENNTNFQLLHTSIEDAQFALIGSKSTFDPAFASSFNAFRFLSPQYTQLGGAPTLSQLTQTTLLGWTQTVESGANYQVQFNANKFSSNSSFNIFNPSISTSLAINFTQPLLKGAGFAINRAPIVVAQRGVKQSQDGFEENVNDIILQVVNNYWNVVAMRENLKVTQESMDAAQKSYDHDKKSLELGALPPLDIYRSESTVASRKVSVIQAEYALKQAEDQFRQVIGADIDPNIRAYDLDLTETAVPSETMEITDIPTAMEKALNYRPEMDSIRLQLENDDTVVKVARNAKLPNLSVSGSFQTNGLGGAPTSGLGDSLSQTFGADFPGYGFTVSLSLPVRNRGAEAALGRALAAKKHDLYSERQLREQITLNVTNAVHQLEQAKQSVAAAKIALDLSQKTLQADQRKYELGSETIFFVLEAQTELTAAEQTLLQAEVGYQDAVAQVDHDTGGLLDRYHVQIQAISR